MKEEKHTAPGQGVAVAAATYDVRAGREKAISVGIRRRSRERRSGKRRGSSLPEYVLK